MEVSVCDDLWQYIGEKTEGVRIINFRLFACITPHPVQSALCSPLSSRPPPHHS
ncbi:Protein of unknown function [Pyronema omphalodes CBS 100304]|uniref:Uncharacterized protein n=1 Tax=Pyronema omphalodes (strain CBS 100304) TaxID=1076935 RepID=U4LCW3_PYROM|nr:Protein of unknown function [Pyronema omphalodes CBS 100304]